MGWMEMFLRVVLFILFVSPEIGPFLVSASQSNVYPLHRLIEDHYHLEVFEWKGEAADVLEEVADVSAREFNANVDGLVFDRTNEVGLAVERILQSNFNKSGLHCGVPQKKSGRKQSTGYPDLMFESGGKCFYLEVKTFSTQTIDSSQRTFYFTLSDDPKVIQNAFHLLIGFEVEKLNDANYQILRYHIVDLRHLGCRMKVEYNANNRDLYGDDELGYRMSGDVD